MTMYLENQCTTLSGKEKDMLKIEHLSKNYGDKRP